MILSKLLLSDLLDMVQNSTRCWKNTNYWNFCHSSNWVTNKRVKPKYSYYCMLEMMKLPFGINVFDSQIISFQCFTVNLLEEKLNFSKKLLNYLNNLSIYQVQQCKIWKICHSSSLSQFSSAKTFVVVQNCSWIFSYLLDNAIEIFETEYGQSLGYTGVMKIDSNPTKSLKSTIFVKTTVY